MWSCGGEGSTPSHKGGQTLRFLPRAVQQLKLLPRLDTKFHFRRPRVDTKPPFDGLRANK